MEGPSRLGAGICLTVALAALALHFLAHPSALPRPPSEVAVDSRLVEVLLGAAAADPSAAGLRLLLSAVAGAGGVGVMYAFLRVTRVERTAALWLCAGFAFGTAHWWAAAAGDAAGLGHVLGVMLALLGLSLALAGRWPLASGLLLGLAAAARLPMALLLPLYVALYLAAPRNDEGAAERGDEGDGRRAARRWLVTAGPLVAGVLVPLVALGAVPAAGYGLHNAPVQAHTALLRSFDLAAQPPWFRPSWAGMAVLLATPLYAWLWHARSRAPAVAWGWASLALIAGATLLSPSTGAPQFGYRPSLDAAPALFLLLAFLFRNGLDRGARAGLVATVAINAYGMVVVGTLDPPFAGY